jgi:hypothetical protein
MKISRLYDFLDTFDSSRSGLSLEKSSPSSFSVKNGSVSDADIFWEVNVMKQIRQKKLDYGRIRVLLWLSIIQ